MRSWDSAMINHNSRSIDMSIASNTGVGLRAEPGTAAGGGGGVLRSTRLSSRPTSDSWDFDLSEMRIETTRMRGSERPHQHQHLHSNNGGSPGVDKLTDEIAAPTHRQGQLTVKPPVTVPSHIRLAGYVDSEPKDDDLLKVVPSLKELNKSGNAMIGYLDAVSNQTEMLKVSKAPKFMRMTDVPADREEELLNNSRAKSLHKLKTLRKYKFGLSPSIKDRIFEQEIGDKKLGLADLVEEDPDAMHLHGDLDGFKTVDYNAIPLDDNIYNTNDESGHGPAPPIRNREQSYGTNSSSRASSARATPLIASSALTGLSVPSSPSGMSMKPSSPTSFALPDRDLAVRQEDRKIANYQLIENIPSSSQRANAGSVHGEKLYDPKMFRRPLEVSAEQLLEEKIKEQEELYGGGSASAGGSPTASVKSGKANGLVEESKFSALVDSSAELNGKPRSSKSRNRPGPIHCSQCSNPGTLWCQQCALAYCYVCWGQVSHHSQVDVGPMIAESESKPSKHGKVVEEKSYHSYTPGRDNVDLSSLPFRLPKKPYLKHKDYHFNSLVLGGTGKIAQLKNDYLRPMFSPTNKDLKGTDPEQYEDYGDSDNDSAGAIDTQISSLNDSLSLSRSASGPVRTIRKRQPLLQKVTSLSILLESSQELRGPSNYVQYQTTPTLTAELEKQVGFSKSLKAKELEDKKSLFQKTSRANLPGEKERLEIERKRRRKYKKLARDNTLNRGPIISVGPHGSVSCVPPRKVGEEAKFIDVKETNLLSTIESHGESKDRNMAYFKGKVVFTTTQPTEITEAPRTSTPGARTSSRINSAQDTSALQKDEVPPHGTKMGLMREIATTRAFMEELGDEVLDDPKDKSFNVEPIIFDDN